MSDHLNQHLVVVTGASRGLGRAIAERLQAAGCQVLGLSRQAPPAPDGIEQWPVDLAEPLAVAERLKAWLRAFGNDRFASVALVNNAALLTPPRPLRDGDLATLARSVRVGLEAPLLLARPSSTPRATGPPTSGCCTSRRASGAVPWRHRGRTVR